MDKKIPAQYEHIIAGLQSEIEKVKKTNPRLAYLYAQMQVELADDCMCVTAMTAERRAMLLVAYAYLDGTECDHFYTACMIAALHCPVFPAGLWGQIYSDKFSNKVNASSITGLSRRNAVDMKIAILSFDRIVGCEAAPMLQHFDRFCANDDNMQIAA